MSYGPASREPGQIEGFETFAQVQVCVISIPLAG